MGANMRKYLNLFFSILLVILYLKGNANPFRYPDADGVIIHSPEGIVMSVIICNQGKPIDTIPAELVDIVTIECAKQPL